MKRYLALTIVGLILTAVALYAAGLKPSDDPETFVIAYAIVVTGALAALIAQSRRKPKLNK